MNATNRRVSFQGEVRDEQNPATAAENFMEDESEWSSAGLQNQQSCATIWSWLFGSYGNMNLNRSITDGAANRNNSHSSDTDEPPAPTSAIIASPQIASGVFPRPTANHQDIPVRKPISFQSRNVSASPSSASSFASPKSAVVRANEERERLKRKSEEEAAVRQTALANERAEADRLKKIQEAETAKRLQDEKAREDMQKKKIEDERLAAEAAVADAKRKQLEAQKLAEIEKKRLEEEERALQELKMRQIQKQREEDEARALAAAEELAREQARERELLAKAQKLAELEAANALADRKAAAMAEQQARDLRRRKIEMESATRRAHEEAVREENRRRRHQELAREVARSDSSKRDANQLLQNTLQQLSGIEETIIPITLSEQATQLEEAIEERELQDKAAALISSEIEKSRQEAEQLALALLGQIASEVEPVTVATAKRLAEEADLLETAVKRRQEVEALADSLAGRIREENEMLDQAIYHRLVQETATATAAQEAIAALEAVGMLEEAIMNKVSEEEQADLAVQAAKSAKQRAEESLLAVLHRLELEEASVATARAARQEAEALEKLISERIAQDQAAAEAAANALKARTELEMVQLSMLKMLTETEARAAALALQEAKHLEELAMQRIKDEEAAAAKRAKDDARLLAELEKKRLAEEHAAEEARKLKEQADRQAEEIRKKIADDELAAKRKAEEEAKRQQEAERLRLAEEEAARIAVERAREEAEKAVEDARRKIAAEQEAAQRQAEIDKLLQEEEFRISREKELAAAAEIQRKQDEANRLAEDAIAARKRELAVIEEQAMIKRLNEERAAEEAVRLRLAEEAAAALAEQERVTQKAIEAEAAEKRRLEDAMQKELALQAAKEEEEKLKHARLARIAEEKAAEEARAKASLFAEILQMESEEEASRRLDLDKLQAEQELLRQKLAQSAREVDCKDRSQVKKPISHIKFVATDSGAGKTDPDCKVGEEFPVNRDNQFNTQLVERTELGLEFPGTAEESLASLCGSGSRAEENVVNLDGIDSISEYLVDTVDGVNHYEEPTRTMDGVDFSTLEEEDEAELYDIPDDLIFDEDTSRLLKQLDDIDRRKKLVLDDLHDLTGDLRETYGTLVVSSFQAAYEPPDFIQAKWYYVPHDVNEWLEYDRLWFKALDTHPTNEKVDSLPHIQCFQFLLKSMLSFDLVVNITDLYSKDGRYTRGRFYCALRYVALVQCGAIRFFREHIHDFDGVDVGYPKFDFDVNQSYPTYPHTAMWDGFTPLNGDTDETVRKSMGPPLTQFSLNQSSGLVSGTAVQSSPKMKTPKALAQRLLRGPELFQGYLRVEGVVLKSWKKKYFQLAEGLLYCFGSDKEANAFKLSGWEPLLLAGYIVTNPSKRFIKLARGEQGKELLLEAANAADLNYWLAAFGSHVLFANTEYPELASTPHLAEVPIAKVPSALQLTIAVVPANPDADIVSASVATQFQHGDIPLVPEVIPESPSELQGYLRQESLVMKSWKKKYFVASEGYLLSYGSEKDAVAKKISSWDPLLLAGYQILNPSKRFIKVVRGDKDRTLMLEASCANDLTLWMQTLKAHSLFAGFVSSEILAGRRKSIQFGIVEAGSES